MEGGQVYDEDEGEDWDAEEVDMEAWEGEEGDENDDDGREFVEGVSESEDEGDDIEDIGSKGRRGSGIVKKGSTKRPRSEGRRGSEYEHELEGEMNVGVSMRSRG